MPLLDTDRGTEAGEGDPLDRPRRLDIVRVRRSEIGSVCEETRPPRQRGFKTGASARPYSAAALPRLCLLFPPLFEPTPGPRFPSAFLCRVETLFSKYHRPAPLALCLFFESHGDFRVGTGALEPVRLLSEGMAV